MANHSRDYANYVINMHMMVHAISRSICMCFRVFKKKWTTSGPSMPAIFGDSRQAECVHAFMLRGYLVSMVRVGHVMIMIIAVCSEVHRRASNDAKGRHAVMKCCSVNGMSPWDGSWMWRVDE